MENVTSKAPTRVAVATRRSFLRQSTSALAAGPVFAAAAVAPRVHAAGDDTLRIGLVGCGGRGSGAAVQALTADPHTVLVAMADPFADRLEASLKRLRANRVVGERVQVDPDHRFDGFDGYRHVIDSDVDVVLLATPPHFRPRHLRACIEANKHVFAEKPVAVDAPGVRSVLATTEMARQRNLCIVSGLNTRYSFIAQEAVRRVHEGAVGDVVALHSVRYGGGVWTRPRQPEMTEMQYQMLNWYYYTWLSGDFNVEQFVHQMDFCAWLMNDRYPVRCYGTGGRQARTGPDHGHIYDHFATTFEFENGVRLFSSTRHQRGCSNESGTYVFGTDGTASLAHRAPSISGKHPWKAPRAAEKDSHQLEHDAFFAALRAGRTINNGLYMAKSSLMAIMARMSSYTGQSLTWDQTLNSTEELKPTGYTWDAEPPAAKVAIPGVTKFV